MPLRLFDAVREEATAYDVAVNYGLKPNRTKMICCPFHQAKHPSMKVDRHYYGFGCGVHGDAIDFVARSKVNRLFEMLIRKNGGKI